MSGEQASQHAQPDEGRGTPQGPDQPAAQQPVHASVVLGWKKLGHEQRLKAYIVNYADDLVICCCGGAQEALTIMRDMMSKMKLTVNETRRESAVCRKRSSIF